MTDAEKMILSDAVRSAIESKRELIKAKRDIWILITVNALLAVLVAVLMINGGI